MRFPSKKLRFTQKNDQKFHFSKKSVDTWFLRALVGTLTILFNFPAFSQQAKPLFIVNSIPTYKQLVRASPGQKLVRVSSFLHPVYSNIYYSTSQNFTHTILYGKDHELYLVEKAAKQLALVQDSLEIIGLDLMIFDCYRPYQFTKKMWEIVPDERYTANPAKGSGHNRGAAIDLTIINAQTHKELEMPTGYDNFSDTAHHNFNLLTAAVKKNRALLRGIMEHFGFVAMETEWWHYSLPDASSYPVFDLSFTDMKEIVD